PQPQRVNAEAAGVTRRRGGGEPLFAEGTPRGERPQFGMACGESGTGEHGGQEALTEAFVMPSPLEGRHGLPEILNRPPIVALGLMGPTEVAVLQRLQDDLPAG